jgi:hypothetical protein
MKYRPRKAHHQKSASTITLKRKHHTQSKLTAFGHHPCYLQNMLPKTAIWHAHILLHNNSRSKLLTGSSGIESHTQHSFIQCVHR